jgi:hypothetical protein
MLRLLAMNIPTEYVSLPPAAPAEDDVLDDPTLAEPDGLCDDCRAEDAEA